MRSEVGANRYLCAHVLMYLMRQKNLTFMPWPVDIGGKFVHGENPALLKLATDEGWDRKFLFDVSLRPVLGSSFDAQNALVYLGTCHSSLHLSLIHCTGRSDGHG